LFVHVEMYIQALNTTSQLGHYNSIHVGPDGTGTLTK